MFLESLIHLNSNSFIENSENAQTFQIDWTVIHVVVGGEFHIFCSQASNNWMNNIIFWWKNNANIMKKNEIIVKINIEIFLEIICNFNDVR